MTNEKSSVESVLEKILTKIELECREEKRVIKHAIKRKIDDILVINKRRKLTLNEEIQCRICYDSTQQLPIIYPCKCKGTMGAIHLKCLEHWLEESNRNSCELCGHQYEVRRTPRYHVLYSIIIWMCLNQQQHQLYVRSLKADLIRGIIITPMAIGCSYICIVAADFYANNNYDNLPPARWTTYLLLIMMSLLLFSYFIWMYMVIEYHQKVWFYWWQKTSTVTIILNPENITSINYKSNVSQV
ncbi:E3 ubiquitin-protein ligase MARCHF3-like isoform X1 [Osmia bicornis bicornis]|uniref:E3 ubiquitin-protein ligase MARCHF3-like isoform X1 n=1 Tax=Osmia bicornis bicornis TaxID=1437191 RepID=UPI0010F4AEF4|nr:E3 ubiquitin-protein ligase MARCHF3-like isoform X1 [Osmia bicornis bicornis]